MTQPQRKREQARADRVLPGVWRLRLPLPWPGVPHGNAWAVRHGERIVLFDTGIYDEQAMTQLESGLHQAGFRVEDIELLVCTHAHSDHYGMAAPIVERAGCELWMHPNHAHMTKAASNPERALERRIEVAAQSGVPLEPLERWAEERRKDSGPGVASVILPDRELLPGVEIETDLGAWSVHETPGHAPSHVVLFQPERRLLISGDHLLGRVSLYFDYGWTPDPVAEFLASLDAVEKLDARLCLPGHGRPFTDVKAHIEANRNLIAERLAATHEAIGDGESTAYELVPRLFGADAPTMMMNWMMTLTLCFLNHLERAGLAERIRPSDEAQPERWRALAPTVARP
jgi:glyoxylase-like metal-dependent hydrolase (beta-lactamase superfamily II)